MAMDEFLCERCNSDLEGQHFVVNEFGTTLCKECHCGEYPTKLEEWDMAEVIQQ